jgi:hypothetical protein
VWTRVRALSRGLELCELIALVRFENEAAARANKDVAKQNAWWEQIRHHLEDPMFHDRTLVDLINDGGSDDAGFVQMIQGQATDVDRPWELDKTAQGRMNEMLPVVIVGSWRGILRTVASRTPSSPTKPRRAKEERSCFHAERRLLGDRS